MMNKHDYIVKLISRAESLPFILNIHYAHRSPSISYAYGLFLNELLVGIATYGTPPSSTLRMGVAGKENISRVLELNRLCLLNNLPNEASFLVSKSPKLLPPNSIVVSFADTEQNHKGYVYQACNFKYYGLSAKRTDWKVKGMEHLHGCTIADKTRGMEHRADKMREIYGDNFYLKPRPRKHRYIYITGKKPNYNIIKYKQEKYPK